MVPLAHSYYLLSVTHDDVFRLIITTFFRKDLHAIKCAIDGKKSPSVLLFGTDSTARLSYQQLRHFLINIKQEYLNIVIQAKNI